MVFQSVCWEQSRPSATPHPHPECVVCMLAHVSRDPTMKQKPSPSCERMKWMPWGLRQPPSAPVPSLFAGNRSLNCVFRSCWTGGWRVKHQLCKRREEKQVSEPGGDRWCREQIKNQIDVIRVSIWFYVFLTERWVAFLCFLRIQRVFKSD